MKFGPVDHSRPAGRPVHVAVSVTGSSHGDSVCQDSSASAELVADEVWALVIADGLGSAKRSDEGSRAAVRSSVEFLATQTAAGFVHGATNEAELRAVLEETFVVARDTVLALATTPDEVRQFSTTLSVGLVTQSCFAIGSVGDSMFFVGTSEGAVTSIDLRERHEHANEVTSLLGARALERVRYHASELGDAVGLFACTDGLESLLLLDLATVTPNARLILKLHDFVVQPGIDDETRRAALTSFLFRPDVRRFSNDDMTLAMIVWPRGAEDSGATAPRPADDASARRSGTEDG